MSDSSNGSSQGGFRKTVIGFFGTFFSLLLAFICKDYLCKAYYIYCLDADTRPYLTILKTVVDDDVHKRIRVADDTPVPIVKKKIEPISQSNSNEGHMRIQDAINNLSQIEIIKE